MMSRRMIWLGGLMIAVRRTQKVKQMYMTSKKMKKPWKLEVCYRDVMS